MRGVSFEARTMTIAPLSSPRGLDILRDPPKSRDCVRCDRKGIAPAPLCLMGLGGTAEPEKIDRLQEVDDGRNDGATCSHPRGSGEPGVRKRPEAGAGRWRGADRCGLIPFDRDGAAADYVAVLASDLAPRPSTVSFVEAAAVPLAALTAWQALRDRSVGRQGRAADRNRADLPAGGRACRVREWFYGCA